MYKKIFPLAALLITASCSEKPVQYEASITPFRDGKQCAISFTYDDGMLCHYTDVAVELEKRGFRGTFWIIGANMDKDEPDYAWMTWDQVADLSKRGHEMSNHTWNHPSLPSLTIEQVAEELVLCDDKIEEVTGKRPITMAYPYNAMSPEVVAKCEEGRVGTRTFQVGHGQKDSHSTLQSMSEWLQGLLDQQEWGVTMTHGTTYGWDMWDDPTELWQFYDVVKAHEDSVWVGTFAQVAAYQKEAAAATLSVTGTRKSATVSVQHSLDHKLFAEKLTVALKGTDWKDCTPVATQNGEPVSVINGGDQLLIAVDPCCDAPVELRW